jgi:succinyl-CoA synthetase alpha subunit
VSILVDGSTRVLVQGITGAQARLDTRFALEYGTRVVAGVTPGKGGDNVHGVPVYNTVESALRDHAIDAAVIYVPGPSARDAALESIEAAIRLVLLMPEAIPQHDFAAIYAAAQRSGTRLIGPNSNGVISPGKSKLGGLGGDRPERCFVPGSVGIMSRSGGMAAEIAWTLRRQDIGVSTCVSVGGDGMIGSTFADLLPLFEADEETATVVLLGEPGTTHEENAADVLVAGGFTKPLIAMVVGQFIDDMPEEVSFGHTAAMVSRGRGSPAAKLRRLHESGARIADSLADLPLVVRSCLLIAGTHDY